MLLAVGVFFCCCDIQYSIALLHMMTYHAHHVRAVAAVALGEMRLISDEVILTLLKAQKDEGLCSLVFMHGRCMKLLFI